MGQQQSTPDGNKNHCCFLGVPGFAKRASMDMMGSPEPQTPMHQRRKRAQVAKEARSSVYGGLEKEVPEFALDSEATSNGKTNGEAIVHEGPVSTLVAIDSWYVIGFCDTMKD